MELEEMAMRLKALEDAKNAEEQAQRQQQFMSRYGDRISGNENLGLAIMNTLAARGVNVDAADDAVQDILNELRQQAMMLLDVIKEQKAETMQQYNEISSAVLDYADKINDISQTVENSADAGPAPEEQTMPQEVPVEQEQTMPQEVPVEQEQTMPQEVPVEQEQAMPQEVPVEQEQAMPQEVPVEQEQVPQEVPVEQGAVSDERVKNIKAKLSGFLKNRVVSDKRMKNVKMSAAKPTKPIASISLSSNILAACRGE